MKRQAPKGGEPPAGRIAQRRRTSKAIVEATSRLLARGVSNPSALEIAREADVSRRTIYVHFPSMDQLVLVATIGGLSSPFIDAELARNEQLASIEARLERFVHAIHASAKELLPLGRRLIKLSVDLPPQPSTGPRRGQRRVGWIERAIAPLRGKLSREQFERLVSALTVLIGWEAMVVLRDLRGLDPLKEERVVTWAALALVKAIEEEARGRSRK